MLLLYYDYYYYVTTILLPNYYYIATAGERAAQCLLLQLGGLDLHWYGRLSMLKKAIWGFPKIRGTFFGGSP